MKKIQPRAVLIDMDGTLYDSMPNHTAAWYRLACELGIEATRDEFYMHEGRTGADTIGILVKRQFGREVTDQEAKALYKKKSEYFQQMPPVHPVAGVKRLLEAFVHAGLKRVLVTGSGQQSLLSRLDVDFPGVFRPELRITSANVTHGKPHPEPYLKAMAMAMVEPYQAVALENAPLGVESAARSGAFTVAVTTGPIPRQAFVDAGADVIYDSMEQCADLLPELLFKNMSL